MRDYMRLVSSRTGMLMLLGSFLLCGSIIAQPSGELADNPQYASWARCQPGTSVTMAMDTSSGGQSMTMTMTQKLLEVKPDQVVLEMTGEMEMGGTKHNAPPRKMTLDAKVPKEQAKMAWMAPNANGTVKEAGNESVEAGGKSYDCKVMEFTGQVEGTKSKGKVWLNDEVPGQVVKTEMQTEGAVAATISMLIKAVDKK